MLIPLASFAVMAFCAYIVTRMSLKGLGLSDYSENPSNYWQIDGLRFFLAFGVFVHHTFITRQYLATGVWQLTDSRLVTFYGQAGVSLFFIITAFLFWNKALKVKGKVDVPAFFLGRIRRLYPAYLTTVLLIILALLPQIDLKTLDLRGLKDIFYLLCLGAFRVGSVQGVDLTHLYAGVFWTLFYEWRFYILLPLLYIVFCAKNYLYVIRAICLSIILASLAGDITSDWPFISLFSAGILSATLVNNPSYKHWQPKQNGLLLAIFVIIAMTLFSNEEYYGAGNPLLFMLIFLCILKISRISLLGALLSRPKILTLGAASYSIYVIHGLVLFFLSSITAKFTFATEEIRFVTIALLGSVLVPLLSLVIFKYIELPLAFKRNGPFQKPV